MLCVLFIYFWPWINVWKMIILFSIFAYSFFLLLLSSSSASSVSFYWSNEFNYNWSMGWGSRFKTFRYFSFVALVTCWNKSIVFPPAFPPSKKCYLYSQIFFFLEINPLNAIASNYSWQCTICWHSNIVNIRLTHFYFTN